MRKSEKRESQHKVFGGFVREELERQKSIGILNRDLLRFKCGVRSSYLTDIKRGMVTLP